MFCHDPELQLVLMPFPVTFSEDTETLTWHLSTLALLLLSEILLVLRHPLVRFWPHLLMHKYHVLSMEYFLDVTLFIPKEKTGFFMVTYIPSIVLTQPAQRRTALTAT